MGRTERARVSSESPARRAIVSLPKDPGDYLTARAISRSVATSFSRTRTGSSTSASARTATRAAPPTRRRPVDDSRRTIRRRQLALLTLGDPSRDARRIAHDQPLGGRRHEHTLGGQRGVQIEVASAGRTSRRGARRSAPGRRGRSARPSLRSQYADEKPLSANGQAPHMDGRRAPSTPPSRHGDSRCAPSSSTTRSREA